MKPETFAELREIIAELRSRFFMPDFDIAHLMFAAGMETDDVTAVMDAK